MNRIERGREKDPDHIKPRAGSLTPSPFPSLLSSVLVTFSNYKLFQVHFSLFDFLSQCSKNVFSWSITEWVVWSILIMFLITPFILLSSSQLDVISFFFPGLSIKIKEELLNSVIPSMEQKNSMKNCIVFLLSQGSVWTENYKSN